MDESRHPQHGRQIFVERPKGQPTKGKGASAESHPLAKALIRAADKAIAHLRGEDDL